MNRDPGRIARELREIDPDPYDWIEGPATRPKGLTFTAWGAIAFALTATGVIVALVCLVILLLKNMP
jgi:hypothetical protein